MEKPDPTMAAQQEAAQLAAATFDLWQEQWRLLAEDSEAQQNIQAMLELLGRNAAFWDQHIKRAESGQFSGGQGGGDDAAKSAGTGSAAAAAASGAGGADLAQLAAAVAELAAKIDRIERRLEQQPAPKPRRAAGKSGKT